MSMGLRYQGGFHDLDNGLYDILIYQDGFVGDTSRIAFTDTPVIIEWMETDKLEPVQSSKATLQLYSDHDRQFVDLYTIKAGSVRLDVYYQGSLYWSGTLDPELYEEPFAYKDNYGVELVFSDLSILDRVKYAGRGFITLRDLVDNALALSRINYTVVSERVSTGIDPMSVGKLGSDVCLLSDNFYDEDNEPMSWREVLDETLRVFSLRLIQKNGKVELYDLNAVSALTPERIEWRGEDSTYSVDKVYNNVTVKFSPYHHNDMLDAGVDHDSVTGGEELSVRVNQDMSTRLQGFRVRISYVGEGLDIGGGVGTAKYFAITPVFSGNKEAGVAYTIKIDHTGQGGDGYTSYLNEASPLMPLPGALLLRAPEKPYIANVPGSGYKLRVTMEMMADVRYNPYETDNEEGDQERMRDWCNFSYVPFRLILRDASGNAVSHYENKEVKALKGRGAYNYDKAGWVSGEGSWGDAFLAYYNIDDRKGDTGLLGWQTNRQCIGYYRDGLPKVFHKRGDGEFMDLPPGGGWLDLQIGKGLLTYDYKNDTEWQTKVDIYWRVRWLLFKSLKISLMDGNFQDIKAEDIEITAWLNKDAKEDLRIETVIGCLDRPSPTALGQVFLTGTREVRNSFYRAGLTDRLERLMIGTVYTNYADRHTVLSGTVGILREFGIYTDGNEPGNFLLLSESQDLRNGTGEIKMARFEADSFEGIKYK